MNDPGKYVSIYPERAVAPLRDLLDSLLEGIVGSQYGTSTRVELKDLQKALNEHDRLGFPRSEPIFVLRGQDVLAPDVVRFYAEQAAVAGAFDIGEGKREGQAALDRLLEFADAMEAWEPRKLPD